MREYKRYNTAYKHIIAIIKKADLQQSRAYFTYIFMLRNRERQILYHFANFMS